MLILARMPSTGEGEGGGERGEGAKYLSLLLELITELAVARALPGTYTVQQLRERIQDEPTPIA
jgi:hypothetical protein